MGVISVRPRVLGWYRFNPADGRPHMSENGSRRVPERDRRDGKDLAVGDEQTPVDRCEGSVWGRSRAEGMLKFGF